MEHAHSAGHCAAPVGGNAPAPAADAGLWRRAGRIGRLWALGAAAGLALVYGVTLSLLNGTAYAWENFLALWVWMVPLVGGFAVQAGLFGYSRALARAGVSPHASGVMASGGASAAAMVACCAHHLTDVLPLVGLAGVALFLGSYQSLFLLAGVLSNAVGTLFLLGEMQRHGLYRRDGAVLAPLLRLPVRRALPYVAAGAALILATAIYWEVWR